MVCRPNLDVLLLWPRLYSFSTDETTEIDPGQVLLVLETKQHEDKFLTKISLTEEWKGGAYLVLSGEGKLGWVGEGWVVPVRKKYARQTNAKTKA